MAEDADAAPAAPEPSRLARLEHAVAEWFGAHIHNSPVSRATEAFNHLAQALPRLIAALAKDI
jgi:hypothetical protein